MAVETLADLTESLAGLGETNALDFSRSPRLARAYESALRGTIERRRVGRRLAWIPDRKTTTCGRSNCWTPFRDLVDLYPFGAISIDCKGISAAHAGYLAWKKLPAWVGIRPGKRISHALCGTGEGLAAPPVALDLSVLAGMDPLPSYGGRIYWQRVKL